MVHSPISLQVMTLLPILGLGLPEEGSPLVCPHIGIWLSTPLSYDRVELVHITIWG